MLLFIPVQIKSFVQNDTLLLFTADLEQAVRRVVLARKRLITCSKSDCEVGTLNVKAHEKYGGKF